MLTPILNKLILTLDIVGSSPLLVKEGRWEKKNKTDWPDNIFVSYLPDGELKEYIEAKNYNLKFYIPGATLKGIMRQRAEYIINHVFAEHGKQICCNPFAADSCGKYIENLVKNDSIAANNGGHKAGTIFSHSCPVCKLFGNTMFKGRIQIEDATVESATDITTKRDHVAIDRFTGGARHGALFSDLCIKAGTLFSTRLTIINFERWQLGLLAYILRDMEFGQVTLGSGKSKGYARIEIKARNLVLKYAPSKAGLYFEDITDINPDLCEKYGCAPSVADSRAQISLQKVDTATDGFYQTYKPETDSGIAENGFWQYCAGFWNALVEKSIQTDSGYFKPHER